MIAKTGAALTRYLKKYNISKETYLEMLDSQGGVCKICHQDLPLVLDHDHACCDAPGVSCGKCVRGLLCSPCNLFIGLAEDSPKTLASSIIYLHDTSLEYKD